MRRASSALTLREVSSRYLAVGEAAERDQPGRADRHPELGAREAHPEVRAADPQVAGDRDLGSPAHHRAVAGGDGRLRKAGQLVVELGEELHPADPALLVELLADVGAGGEAEVVVGGDHQDARLLVLLRPRQVDEQFLQHLRC